MENNYISCGEYADRIKHNLKNIIQENNLSPILAIIQVGCSIESKLYTNGKMKDCDEVGIKCNIYKFNKYVTESELIKVINKLNNNFEIGGIIVQLPLPSHMNEENVKRSINVTKDIDGLNKNTLFEPCTPLGIVRYLKANSIDLIGKRVTILGRSELVGKPLARMLTDEDCTVTICHSKTNRIEDYTAESDIIISAVGIPKIINKNSLLEKRNDYIIIDVGINLNEKGKLCGDVDYDAVKDKCKLITTVPRGVGLLTRVTLLENLLEKYK